MLNTGKLAGKVLYITGASRGIGKAIALKAAQDGAKIVVAAKTAEPHPKLPGTIYTAAEEIEAAGGQALPCIVDIRNEDQIQDSIEQTVKKFGGIDILINNASAINLTGTLETPMKKFDLMHSINTRGTYLVSKLALPYLKISKNNPHILNISPPLNMNPRWFRDHCAYTMAKYGMSMCVLGMAEEFKSDNIAVNALWPKTAIITAAMEMLGGGGDVASQCRKVDIMSDAAYVMLTRDSRSYTGNFAIDEAVLREEGVKEFDQYAVVPGADLLPDFFLEESDDPANIMSDLGAKPRFVKGEDTAAKAKGGAAKVQDVFDKLGKVVNEDLVKKTQAIYAFKVAGDDGGLWYIDLKNAPGAIGSGEPTKGAADCTFSLTDENFHKMFSGTLKPMNAFMSGKLKIEGNMGKAMALDKLMGKMQTRGFHTGQVRRCAPPANYQDVPQIFTRIGEVANADMVKKVNASYIFEVEGEDTYLVDLKEGEGRVAKADPDSKADVKITMNKENMLKMFNRELKPATAFMTGKLKLSGDLAKAMALEAVMKASREQGFHTSAHRFSSEGGAPNYTAVPQVFDRIQAVASPEIVSKVQAIYQFDVSDEGKYYIDFKNGDGSVGKGEPSTKADVTITMTTENFLKIFNRELSPASGFMTGKIKVSGDLSKALTLEAVMKASRGE